MTHQRGIVTGGGSQPGRSVYRFLAAGALAAVLALPGLASAQEDADFLFERPRLRFGMRTGVALPSANSQIFDFSLTESEMREIFELGGELDPTVAEQLGL